MAAQSSTPLQLVQFQLKDFQSEEGINRLNQYLVNHTKAVNSLLGTGGPMPAPAGIDAQGAKISNVGGVGPEHEVVSKAYAEANYSATALKPKLEGGGSHALQTVRRVGDGQQKEPASDFLDNIMSTAPTTNSATISGSGDTATVSAGFHYHTSGQIVPFASRTDTVSLPASVTITTLSRTSSIVTVTTSTPHGLTPSAVVSIAGASDVSFDGTFVVATVPSPTTFTFLQVASNATATGGTVSEGAYFYYHLPVNSQTLSLAGPYSADSQESRLAVNKDGSVLVAVASFTGGGFNVAQSAAGSTPPPQNSGNHVLTRL